MVNEKGGITLPGVACRYSPATDRPTGLLLFHSTTAWWRIVTAAGVAVWIGHLHQSPAMSPATTATRPSLETHRV